MDKVSSHTGWQKILTISLTIGILPFVINAVFANPWTDDYYYAFIARDRGIVDAFTYYYTHYNGRYFSIALLLASPLTFGQIWAYKLVPPVLILTMLAVIMFLVSEITKGSVSFRSRLLFTLSLSFVYYDQMPDVRPGLYWMPGSITYQVGAILLILLLSILLRIRQGPETKSKLLVVNALILALCLPGTNEVILSLLLSSLILLFCFAYIKRGKPDLFLLTTLAAASIGACFALFTPSNMMRMSNYKGSRNTLLATERAFDATVSSIPVWIGSPLVLALTVLVIAAICQNPQLRSRMRGINPAISTALLVVFIFGTYFIPYWGMGLHPPRRLLNLIYLLFLLGWLTNVAIISAHLSNRIMACDKKSVVKILAPAFAIYVALVISLGHSNLLLVAEDLLKGTSYRYDQELRQRYTYIERNQAPHCIVEILENTPRSLFFSDIDFTTGGWVNRSYADYFSKESIRLRRPDGYPGRVAP